MKCILLFSVLALALLGLPSLEAAEPRDDFARYLDEFPSTKGKMRESERINALYKHEWDYSMLEYPEVATSLGVPGQNHRWTDASLAAIQARKALAPKLLAATGSIDRDRLEPKDRIHYDLFLRGARAGVEGLRFPGEVLAISQLGGLQQNVPGVLIQMPTKTSRTTRTSSRACAGFPPWSPRLSSGWRRGSPQA
jgi:uncharacterized protein (DUF885 family)